MKTFIFLFCTTMFSFSSSDIFSQNAKIVIDSDRTASVDEVFDLIRQQTNYTFLYQEDLFRNVPKVALKKGIIQANKLLEQSLSINNFNFSLTENNTIVIKAKLAINDNRQQFHVSGIVTDLAGLPIPGVTVLIKGTNKGVVTNFDGQYTITVPNAETILVFSSQGSATQEVVVGNRTIINVSLKEFLNKLEEVTINAGYYKTSKKTATGSISKVEATAIGSQPVSNPIAALQGRMTGVEITQSSAYAGGGFKVRIRGQNS
ncbi:MAG: carboxypeptidase-like regulatory domain-containing protein, partial [Bacteriovorax sp.]|nr:carboxypeptidase-like regulatory domain-containing protein [Bacteriovorax sp.]